MALRENFNGLLVMVQHPPSEITSRPPMLFVHGLFGGAWYWDRFSRFFAARGHSCYALDLRGHNGSRPIPDLGTVSMRDYVDDVVEVATAIPRHKAFGGPVVVGHSLGGLVAQKAAETGPTLATVLICPAPPRGIPVFNLRLAWKQLRYIVPMLRGLTMVPRYDDTAEMFFNRVPPAERRANFDNLVPDSGRAAREAALGLVSVDEKLIRAPLLCLCATEDRTIKPRVVRRIADKYGAQLIEYSGYGHFLVAEPGWEKPAGDIARWLDALLPHG